MRLSRVFDCLIVAAAGVAGFALLATAYLSLSRPIAIATAVPRAGLTAPVRTSGAGRVPVLRLDPARARRNRAVGQAKRGVRKSGAPGVALRPSRLGDHVAVVPSRAVATAVASRASTTIVTSHTAQTTITSHEAQTAFASHGAEAAIASHAADTRAAPRAGFVRASIASREHRPLRGPIARSRIVSQAARTRHLPQRASIGRDEDLPEPPLGFDVRPELARARVDVASPAANAGADGLRGLRVRGREIVAPTPSTIVSPAP